MTSLDTARHGVRIPSTLFGGLKASGPGGEGGRTGSAAFPAPRVTAVAQP